MTDNAPVFDPYHHLHDEDYARATARTVGAADMIAMGGRSIISLNGEWRFVLDPYEEGLRQRWYEDEPSDPTTWTIPRDYDGGDWQTITVPGCWTTAAPEWTHYEGAAWYLRWFDSPKIRDGERVFLRVGAALQRARVFVNGTFVGGHLGGSTPFFVEIGPALRPGPNRLQIMVENRRVPDRVPMHHTDWFNDGGLSRDVALVCVPPVFIRAWQLNLTDGGIRVRLTVSDAIDGTAELAIDALNLTASIPVVAGHADVVLEAAPERWSPDRPTLYDTTLTFGPDRVRDRIGFRTIAVDGHTIRLNGAPLYLRGVCCHEDDAHLGRTTSEADIRRRFSHVKALGANAVRLAHYPHHERVAEIADELGILLIAEIPVYWAIAFHNPATLADAQNQLAELMARDANRASVIAWSVGNENDDTDARYEFLKALVDQARRNDGSRLVTAACLISRRTFAVEDRIATELDLVGVNQYFGWYEPDVDQLETLLANTQCPKPIMISECGADAVAGFEGEPGVLFSEAHQADVYDQQLKIVRRFEGVQGYFPWVLYDFRTMRRQTAVQRGWNKKGLIAADKTTRKRAFEVIGAHYREIARDTDR